MEPGTAEAMNFLRRFRTLDKPVILAIDELPILVNRLLKGHDYRITPERRATAADLFLSWLRRNGQVHRGKITLIVSGSIGLDPILSQARLSAQANIFSLLRAEALGCTRPRWNAWLHWPAGMK